MTGEEAKRIESQSDSQTQQEIMTIIRTMFNNDSIPDPTDILVPKWGSDPFFYGSYSNWPIDVDDEDFEVLRSPVGRLFFSGEHTHRRYNGYVHGAFLSGIEAANAVLADIAGNTTTPTSAPDCVCTCSNPASFLAPLSSLLLPALLIAFLSLHYKS